MITQEQANNIAEQIAEEFLQISEVKLFVFDGQNVGYPFNKWDGQGANLYFTHPTGRYCGYIFNITGIRPEAIEGMLKKAIIHELST